MLQIGQVAGPVRVGPIAHGGHCVVRVGGVVVFVRHAVPDEVVTVRITAVQSRFARGDVAEVIEPSVHRRRPPCPVAGACGGCDFQHLPAEHSRELKRQVVAELLQHYAGIEFTGAVEGFDDGFGWRTRMRYHRTRDGRLGLRAHRSDQIVPLPPEGCRIAAPGIQGGGEPPAGESDALGVAARSGVVLADRAALSRTVIERVGGRGYEVASDGFWQSHRLAPEVLVAAVLAGLEPKAGERAFDLFCGVGLFAGALVDAGCSVLGVEGDATATRLARRNVPEARFHTGDVAATLRRLPAQADLVVLDPPRSGAGRSVMAGIAERRPRAIAYVACDPAALARDLGTAADLGYQTEQVRAFDLYGTTHHVECLALLRPQGV